MTCKCQCGLGLQKGSKPGVYFYVTPGGSKVYCGKKYLKKTKECPCNKKRTPKKKSSPSLPKQAFKDLPLNIQMKIADLLPNPHHLKVNKKLRSNVSRNQALKTVPFNLNDAKWKNIVAKDGNLVEMDVGKKIFKAPAQIMAATKKKVHDYHSFKIRCNGKINEYYLYKKRISPSSTKSFYKEMYVGHNLSQRGFRHIFGYKVVGDYAFVVVENPENGNKDVKNMSLYDFLFKYYKNLSRDKRQQVAQYILFTLIDTFDKYVTIKKPFIFNYNVYKNPKDLTLFFMKNIEIVFKDSNVKNAVKHSNIPEKLSFKQNFNNNKHKLRITNITFNVPYSKIDDVITDKSFFENYLKFDKPKKKRLLKNKKMMLDMFQHILGTYLGKLDLRAKFIGEVFIPSILQYYSSLKDFNTIRIQSNQERVFESHLKKLTPEIRNNLKRSRKSRNTIYVKRIKLS